MLIKDIIQTVWDNITPEKIGAAVKPDTIRSLHQNVFANNPDTDWAELLDDGMSLVYTSTEGAWKNISDPPGMYGRVLTAKSYHSGSHSCVQFWFGGGADNRKCALWWRMNWVGGWGGEPVANNSGWTRIACANPDGSIHGAVYN